MSNLDVSLRLRLINQLGGPAKEAKRELEGVGAAAKKLDGAKVDKLNRDLAKTKTEAKGTEAALNQAAAGAKKLDDAKAEKLARNLAKTRAEASGLRKALKQIEGLKQADSVQTERLAQGLRNATAASERLARGLRRVRDEARKVEPGAGLSPSHRAQKVAGAAGEGGSMPGILAGGARAMGALGVGYLGYRSLASGVRTVVDQDKAWAEVRKKVNATPEELAAINTQLRAKARKYGLSISEVFEQAAEAGAAGIDKSDLVGFVELTTRASVGWDTTARETAQRIAEIRAGTGMTLPQIDDLANKINALGDNSAAKERDIVEMFHRSGAAAKAAGVQYDDTLAILTAIRSTGMQEEVASRWFNAFTFDVAGAHAKGDKQQEAWKKLGFNTKDLANGMKTDATGTMLKVFEAINKLEQTKKIEVLSNIFGQGWQDETARAAQAVDEIKKQLDFIHQPKNWQGSLQQNLDIQLSTAANHWERIKTAATETAEQINKATGATNAFSAASESLLARFEKWVGSGGDKKSEAEKPRVDQPAGPRSAYPGRFQSGLHAKATRDALNSPVAPKSSFPGRFQSAAHAAAQKQRDDEVRAAMPLRGPMTPLPPAMSPIRNFSPVPASVADQAKSSMAGVTQAITSEGTKAVAASQSIAERIKAIFNFTVAPTISPRFGGAGASPGAGVPATPVPAAPAANSKRAGLSRSTSIVVNVNGAGKDGRQIGSEVARQLAQLGNSSGALFDTV